MAKVGLQVYKSIYISNNQLVTCKLICKLPCKLCKLMYFVNQLGRLQSLHKSLQESLQV